MPLMENRYRLLSAIDFPNDIGPLVIPIASTKYVLLPIVTDSCTTASVKSTTIALAFSQP